MTNYLELASLLEKAAAALREAHAALEAVPPVVQTRLRDLCPSALSTRAFMALLNNGIKTVEQLVTKTEEDLEGANYIGPATLKEIRAFLKNRGLSLREEPV